MPTYNSPAMWTDDNKLRAVFSYQTRLGLAPKFGSLPIAYYQQDQCRVIDEIEGRAKCKGIHQAFTLKSQNAVLFAHFTDANGIKKKICLGYVTYDGKLSSPF